MDIRNDNFSGRQKCQGLESHLSSDLKYVDTIRFLLRVQHGPKSPVIGDVEGKGLRDDGEVTQLCTFVW